MTRSRKILIAVGTATVLIAAAVGVWIAAPFKQAPVVAAAKPVTFSLLDQDGHLMTEADYRGKWLLVFFGFTDCPDACPTAMYYATDLLKDLGPLAEMIQIAFVSVDPDRDTPAVLKDYLSNFDSRIVGLTGSQEQVSQTAFQFGAYYRQQAVGYTYTIDHSTAFYLVNPEGGLVRAFAPQNGANDVTKELHSIVAASTDDKGIVAHDVWMRASIGQVPTTAAYMTIENRGGKNDRLLSVSTPVASSAQIHDSNEKNGVMQMRPVTELTLAHGKSVELKPGGMHVMVMGLTLPLKAGDRVPLMLHFEHAGEVAVQAEVRGLN